MKDVKTMTYGELAAECKQHKIAHIGKSTKQLQDLVEGVRAGKMPEPKPAAKKAEAKPKAEAKKEKKGPGKIEQILALYKSGKTREQIVAKGFHKTTVAIQCAKFEKGKKK